jgi:hypothetical protein
MFVDALSVGPVLPTENHQTEHANARNTRFSIFVSVRRDMVLPGETG